MLFNSFEFAVFLPIVFMLYWFILNKNLKLQNFLLLIASYVFYGWWDWRFLLLLLFISLSNYLIGLKIDSNQSDKKRKIWLLSGLIINLGVLSVFKYYNFFIDSFIDLVSLTGYDLPRSTTKIILPIGISFYIFLSLSYILDIHKGTLKANKNPVEVLLTLGFFPIILAGPIQRPSSLLPQISKIREFKYDQAVDGLRQILWGLFAKVVIADNLATYVDDFFRNFSNYSGSTLLLGAIFYTVQIYADFSGYSNMAIGIAKLFGFNLMQNFNYPYFSRDITEFWKRWHISLVTWFRDYVFLPLSFNISHRIKGEKVLFVKTDLFIYALASLVVWFLTGLWHGANYTFIVWGLIHGFFLIIYRWQLKPRKEVFKRLGFINNNKLLVSFETIFTLFIVIITWVIFRANSLKDAMFYLRGIFSESIFSAPSIIPKYTIGMVCFYFVFEWFGRMQPHGLANFGLKWNRVMRFTMYYALLVAILWSGGKAKQFIYFQF